MENRKITYKMVPTAQQSALLLSIKRSHKELWNAALEERIDAYRKCGKSISYEDQYVSLTLIRGAIRRVGHQSIARPSKSHYAGLIKPSRISFAA